MHGGEEEKKNNDDLPINRDLTYLGKTTYRDKNTLFGIKRRDRRQHVYVLGKSGTGKSVLLSNMIVQNIQNGDGVAVVDPHGELVEGILQSIPSNRLKDVVYFNPADVDFHIGFNVLELVDAKYKHLVASGLMGIFTKIWANAWSARMEYILNNTILALLDTPGTTLLGVPRMLVDKDYRQQIINNLKDPVIKAFWVHEYEAWQEKFRNEAIAPIQNKVGQFLSTSVIRNIVGQSKSTINIFDMMNEGKIFLVNVSKGRIGEDNSKLIGGMIITKLQLAAMERVRIPEDERKDFYLYVDEFQNFVTDSFASILSEARKYRLNLTVAHQYTAQLVTKESSNVRDAIFGNVGTMIVFRVGADDADFLEKEFAPEFTPEDLVNLPNFKIYLKLMIDGITSRPFSAKTLPPIIKKLDHTIEEQVIKMSRELYCRPRDIVENEINQWSGMSIDDGASGGGNTGEKFKAICSNCGKETFVPFEPTPGRPVYCKECVAKIKSGEVKPIRGVTGQEFRDDSKYFKPLADLGIEFEGGATAQKEKPKVFQNNIPKPPAMPYISKPNIPNGGVQKPFIQGVKKVLNTNLTAPFHKNNANNSAGKPSVPNKNFADKPRENLALKEILNKTLNEQKIIELKKEEKIIEEKKPTPTPVSLNTLQAKPANAEIKPINDRGASADRMNSLKDLLAKVESERENNIKTPEKEQKSPQISVPQKKIEPEIPIPQKQEIPQNNKSTNTQNEPQPQTQNQPIREVPEDVLKKILEDEN